MAKSKTSINGTLLNKRNNKPVANVRIEAWDKQQHTELGESTTDDEGRFTISFSPQAIKTIITRKPDVYFRIFKENNEIATTIDNIHWNLERDGHVNVSIDMSNPNASVTTFGNMPLSGSVASSSGAPIPGIKLVAFIRTLDEEIPVGSATSGPDGKYAMNFEKELPENPDIEVRAIHDNANEIGRSEIKYNAGRTETINVVIPADRVPQLSEYDLLMQDLQPHLNGRPLADLQENSDRQQITYLANKTGWDARLVAMAVQAHKAGGRDAVDPAHLYAIYRAGVAGDDGAVNTVPADKVKRIISSARKNNIVSTQTTDEQTISALRQRATRYFMDLVPGTAVSSLGSMLDIRLQADKKNIFAQTLVETGNDTAAFWTALKNKGFDDNTIKQLQLDGKLGYLTGRNAPLVKKVYEKFNVKSDTDLVKNGLYKAAEWEKFIGTDVPPNVTAKEYATHLADLVKLSYPTAVAGEMINHDEVTLGNNVPKTEVYNFFNANSATNALGFNPVKKWQGYAQLSEPAKLAARKMERIYQMSPSDESMVALSKMDLTSAYHVARYTRNEFLEKHGKDFPTIIEAEKTYKKANEIYSAAINIATGYLTARAMPNVYGITGKLEKKANEIIAYPTLEELFGNMDYCSCDHCKSVLSPAAYMVDLLQFTDAPNIPAGKSNPIDVLFERRPDIQHIQLTCENTNLAMPYIDLVNEILEHYIVNGNLTTLKGHDATEETKQSDLLAEPQYVSETAYNELKTKVYPYHLPYHHALEALRLLFNMWDVKLEDTLWVYSTPAASRQETLQLSSDEYSTLTNRAFRPLGEYFGLPAASTIAQINTAIANGKTFSRRMNISYEDLVTLLKTAFINPGIGLMPLFQKLQVSLADLQKFYDGVISNAQMDAMIPAGTNPADYGGDIKQWLRNNQQLIMGMITLTDVSAQASECNFAQVELRYALPNNTTNSLTEVAYHKFHRFIRLLNKTGWKIATLNKIITALLPIPSQNIDINNIDATFITLLNRLANFKKITTLLDYSEKKFPDLLVVLDAAGTQTLRMEQLGKILKTRVQDLQELKAITNIDPLANDLEQNEPSLLRTIKLVRQLKVASLKFPDLAYLMHHVDESGKLAPAAETLLKHVKLLRDGLNLVEKENGIAPGNADLAFAKSKMGLVYDNAIAEEFFALLTGTKPYSAAFVTIEEGLPAKITAADDRIGFDAFQSQLTYRGIMTNAAKTALENAADTLVLADMGAITVQNDLNTFITDFKARVQQLFNAGATDLTNFGNNYPDLKLVYDAVIVLPTPAEQTKKLIDAILPGLKAKLKTNALNQALTSILKTEEQTTLALTGKKEVTQSALDNTKPVLHDFMKLEDTIAFNQNQQYQFYLDVPATDDYLFYIGAPQNTTVTLVVNGQTIINNVSVGVSKEVKNNPPLNLKAGSLHLVSLTIGALPINEAATISWRTNGMAKTAIPASAITAKANADAAQKSLVRLQKAAQLQRLLKLTPVELEYFAAENNGTKNFVNELDTNGGIVQPALSALWEKISQLAYFSVLKKENEPEENTWVQVFRDPNLKNGLNKNVLESFNLWKEADLTQVLTTLGLVRNDIRDLRKLEKIMKAMEIVMATGYPATDVVTWITANPNYNLINTIKKKVKDNITEAAWLETMPTVSDPLRNKLRDALVSYILHYKKPSAEVDTADKLYEYFLVDVEMDACMKTSRIRLALSTIQLFIQRCFMNLEPKVAPSSLRADHWAWMKRYRVWEANRKVFLYPENWLEPELRDNKSSLFRELEGELLQQEITDESAELAFLNYLKKLDDIAKLEITGMYLEENEKGNQDDDILHVFGRTNGNTRQYYYRRYEYGYWTPWEKVSLTIEGDHIIPVVWRKRLFLFWVNFIDKATEGDRNKKPQADMANEAWGVSAKKNVEINMCWGEYFKGKWTSPKSSELGSSMVVQGVSEFSRRDLLVYLGKEMIENPAGKFRERLKFFFSYRGPGGGTQRDAVFTYTSKNAPPFIEYKTDSELYSKVSDFNYILYKKGYENTGQTTHRYANGTIVTGRTLKMDIKQPAGAVKPEVIKTLLTKKDKLHSNFYQLPMRHIMENQFEAPFIYADERSTFFIKPDEELFMPIYRYDGYYYTDEFKLPDLKEEVAIPPIIKKPLTNWPPDDDYMPSFEGVIRDPWKWNVGINFKNPYYNTVLPNENNFEFEGNVFGTGGKIKQNIQTQF
jgi:hypothetical protein